MASLELESEPTKPGDQTGFELDWIGGFVLGQI